MTGHNFKVGDLVYVKGVASEKSLYLVTNINLTWITIQDELGKMSYTFLTRSLHGWTIEKVNLSPEKEQTIKLLYFR